MSRNAQTLFPELFGGAPNAVREFLFSALQLRDLQKLYDEARLRNAPSVSQGALDQLEIKVKVTKEDLSRIPATGPVVVVANHPYGLLDGLVLDAILARVRADVYLLLNEQLAHVEEFRGRSIPVDVFSGKSATTRNALHLRRALQLLRRQQAIACFPAGEVSHWEHGRFRSTDSPWSSAPFRCAMLAGACVLPVFFGGANSLSFQLVGLVHPRLRTARLAGELLNKRGRTVEVRIGNPISARELGRFGSYATATEYARARTYLLERRGTRKAKHTLRSLPLLRTKPVSSIAVQNSGFRAEMESLERNIEPTAENETYAVYAERGVKIPKIIEEIGRLRESTFRAAGEGTGKSLDVDAFDGEYKHFVLWHKRTRTIAGSYRLTWTDDVLPRRGISGLYTSTLFHYRPGFFQKLGPAVELGRSFIAREFQKDYSALFLLWQAISRAVAARPDSPILFGAVSISSQYSDVSRQLITDFISTHSFDPELARLAVPRCPFRARLSCPELKVISRCIHELDELRGSMDDLREEGGVPVLLRHYLKLGGRVAGFNLDRHFSDTLDGLLIVDLRKTAPKLLERYMGAEGARLFQLTGKKHLAVTAS